MNRFLTRVNAARVEVATEHNLGPHRPVTLMDGGGSGERELCARIAASTDPERDLEHVLDVAIAEAHERGELRWLSWSLASERSWRSRLAASVAEAGPRRSARKAGEAIGAARPRADHPDAPGLKTFGELS